MVMELIRTRHAQGIASSGLGKPDGRMMNLKRAWMICIPNLARLLNPCNCHAPSSILPRQEVQRSLYHVACLHPLSSLIVLVDR